MVTCISLFTRSKFGKLIFLLLLPLSLFMACSDGNSASNVLPSSSVSVGGSFASFTIINKHLYAVSDTHLITLDISNLNNPVTLSNVNNGGSRLETVFNLDKYLFVGSSDGFYVYDISNPNTPTYVSTYFHSVGCDPVIAQGNYAYTTVFEGRACGFTTSNFMEIVDISDITRPTVVDRYNLYSPRGLGIGCNNKLFVCNGELGFIQYDLTDPSKPKLEKTFRDHYAQDIIVQGSTIIVSGEDGVFQYRCENNDLVLLSKIKVQ